MLEARLKHNAPHSIYRLDNIRATMNDIAEQIIQKYELEVWNREFWHSAASLAGQVRQLNKSFKAHSTEIKQE